MRAYGLNFAALNIEERHQNHTERGAADVSAAWRIWMVVEDGVWCGDGKEALAIFAHEPARGTTRPELFLGRVQARSLDKLEPLYHFTFKRLVS